MCVRLGRLASSIAYGYKYTYLILSNDRVRETWSITILIRNLPNRCTEFLLPNFCVAECLLTPTAHARTHAGWLPKKLRRERVRFENIRNEELYPEVFFDVCVVAFYCYVYDTKRHV